MFNIVRYKKRFKSKSYTDYDFYCKYFKNFYDAQVVCNFLNKENNSLETYYKVVGETYKLKAWGK